MPTGNIKIKKMLFATDLSSVAEHAFKYAALLADALDAEVTVLHVLEKLRPNAELMLSAILDYDNLEELRAAAKPSLMERIRKHISGLCEDAVCRVSGCGFDPDRVIIEPGESVGISLKHIVSKRFDLLVMGSRGHGVVEEFLIGGTTHKVLRKTTVPVLVVPEKE